MSTPILATKLYIPPPRSNLVRRHRLIKQLNEGLHGRLSLISAPAGFGKTTLVSEWVNQEDEAQGMKDERTETFHPSTFTLTPSKAAWLSLYEEDSEPTRFLAYFVAALQTIEPKIGEGVLTMLQSPQPPPIGTILTALLNEIATIPDDFILVLDDYHLLDSQPIDQALAFLLDHLPPRMHLVIATRENPQLPLARYRARGQMTELRAADLRFTSSEAAAFLNQMMGLNLSSDEVSALERRTEGWIAGLQLAALSMQGTKDTVGFIKSFTGSHRFVLEYLIEEVLQQQPKKIQAFLLQTSILERLCGSLCDAITGQENSQATLETLEHANLFIVLLDEQRLWYRYHHLFADLLRQRLRQTDPEQIPTLHRRASEWYDQNGLPSGAIRHAIAAEDFERAAALAELAWPAWSGSFESIAWLGWVKALPDELVRTRPVLCVALAWALLNAGKLETAEARLRDAERWVDTAICASDWLKSPPAGMIIADETQVQSLPASLATARAYYAQATGDVSGTVKYTKRVIDLLSEGDHQWRAEATVILGLAYWTSGDLEAAYQTLSDGLASMKPLDIIVGTFVLAEIKAALGQLREAVSLCEYALQLAVAHGEPMPLGTEDVYTAISELHRECGDLEAAEQDLVTSRNLGEQVELPDWQYRWCIAQARLNETRGDLDGALDLLDKAERLFVRTPLPKMRPIAAMKARVWIKQGKLTEVHDWVRKQGLSVEDDLSYLHEFEHITLVRLLIARYKSNRKDDFIRSTMILLDRLLQAAEEENRVGSIIEIWVLQALAHQAQNNIPSAILSLEQALTLAEPEGYVRIFVDEGSPMAALLREAEKQSTNPDYISLLLSAFGDVNPRPITQTLIDPLSKRELDVLRLLGTELSGPEIARELVVSLATVRTHTRNIYSKLGVSNRLAAIRRAEELNLL